MTEGSCPIISERGGWTCDSGSAGTGPGAKAGFSPEKAHGPIPRGYELLSLEQTIQVLRVPKATTL